MKLVVDSNIFISSLDPTDIFHSECYPDALPKSPTRKCGTGVWTFERILAAELR